MYEDSLFLYERKLKGNMGVVKEKGTAINVCIKPLTKKNIDFLNIETS